MFGLCFGVSCATCVGAIIYTAIVPSRRMAVTHVVAALTWPSCPWPSRGCGGVAVAVAVAMVALALMWRPGCRLSLCLAVFLCRCVAFATRRRMLVFAMIFVLCDCLDLRNSFVATKVEAINRLGSQPSEDRRPS